MRYLILGLLVFLGGHSVRIVAEDWRTAQIARFGALGWKALYALLAGFGFALLVWGYGTARAEPVLLWSAPDWTHHLTIALMLPAFVLISAAYVPGNRIKAGIGHPMAAGVALWAGAHLAANGSLADLLLFGSFLLWALLSFCAARGRDRAAGTTYKAGSGIGALFSDLITVVVGLAVWGGFAMFLHLPLIGVRPY